MIIDWIYPLFLDVCSANSFTTRLQHQSRFIPQPPNLELKPIDVRVHQIQRERRAHTMAPISRISGPISTPRGKMFATAAAPVENQPNPYSKIPYEHPDEDHGPIIVKVRYNPQAGGVPSEDAIRKAIGHQIFDRRARKDPIIVNFLQQNPLSNSITTQPSRFFPPTPHPSHRPLPRKIDHLVQIPKPFINQSRVPPAHRTQLTRRKRSPIRTHRDQPKGFFFAALTEEKLFERKCPMMFVSFRIEQNKSSNGYSTTTIRDQ